MAFSPPNKIVIDFLEGVNARADAIASARGFISSHFDVPEESGYYVMPYKDGFAFEVQEGGSRHAYLPSILRTIEESPNATVSVRSGSRVLQVSKGQRGAFNSVLLPEELSSYLENVIEAQENAPALTSYQFNNVVWLLWGLGMVGVGVLLFIFTLGFFMLSPKAPKAMVSATSIEQLPISQWKRMVDKLNGTNYVSQMKYENGQWTFELKNNEGDAPSSVPAPKATEMSTPMVVVTPPDVSVPSVSPVTPEAPAPTSDPVVGRPLPGTQSPIRPPVSHMRGGPR